MGVKVLTAVELTPYDPLAFSHSRQSNWVHGWTTSRVYKLTLDHISLNKMAGLDVMQSHPLCRQPEFIELDQFSRSPELRPAPNFHRTRELVYKGCPKYQSNIFTYFDCINFTQPKAPNKINATLELTASSRTLMQHTQKSVNSCWRQSASMR